MVKLAPIHRPCSSQVGSGCCWRPALVRWGAGGVGAGRGGGGVGAGHQLLAPGCNQLLPAAHPPPRAPPSCPPPGASSHAPCPPPPAPAPASAARSGPAVARRPPFWGAPRRRRRPRRRPSAESASSQRRGPGCRPAAARRARGWPAGPGRAGWPAGAGARQPVGSWAKARTTCGVRARLHTTGRRLPAGGPGLRCAHRQAHAVHEAGFPV